MFADAASRAPEDIRLEGAAADFTGTMFTNTCTHGTCQAEYYDFEVTITSADAAMTVAAGRFKAGMYGRISLRT